MYKMIYFFNLPLYLFTFILIPLLVFPLNFPFINFYISVSYIHFCIVLPFHFPPNYFPNVFYF